MIAAVAIGAISVFALFVELKDRIPAAARLTTSVAAVATEEVAVVADLALIEHTIATAFEQTARRAAVAVVDTAVVAPLADVDDAVTAAAAHRREGAALVVAVDAAVVVVVGAVATHLDWSGAGEGDGDGEKNPEADRSDGTSATEAPGGCRCAHGDRQRALFRRPAKPSPVVDADENTPADAEAQGW